MGAINQIAAGVLNTHKSALGRSFLGYLAVFIDLPYNKQQFFYSLVLRLCSGQNHDSHTHDNERVQVLNAPKHVAASLVHRLVKARCTAYSVISFNQSIILFIIIAWNVHALHLARVPSKPYSTPISIHFNRILHGQ